jgi:transposase
MKIVEMLRLSGMGLSHRKIAASAGCAKSTVDSVLKVCASKGVSYENASKMTDDELHAVVYPQKMAKNNREPDWQAIHEELARNKNLNLQFMWEEYFAANPDGLGYSQFCRRYRAYRKDAGRQVSLHNERKAGELMEVDWIGDTLDCVSVDGGQMATAHFFVAILGYSGLPYVEAFPDEKELSWITANVNALNYYGGVPRIIVPDNCRTAVKTPRYFEPIINSAYWEFAQHYEVAILPARSRKPKDKPVVEQTVGWLETWLLGKLRNQTFFSFEELNKAIRACLKELSEKPFQKREGSRMSEFLRIDEPTLGPLPARKYEIAEVVTRMVGDTYHVEFDGFYYSVPYTLHKERVILRATSAVIEIFDMDHVRVATHIRHKNTMGSRYISNVEHMPTSHQAVYQFRNYDGPKYRRWAASIGDNTYFVIDSLLSGGKIEEQGFRSCMGLLQLTKTYGNERLETACKLARDMGSHAYSTVKAQLTPSGLTPSMCILKNGMVAVGGAAFKATPDHDNIRGSEYYR